jgi:glycosyltransferase involved in cell wall biosynthesis
MKILFLCNKSPYPAREGGPIAMDMMIEGMIRAGHHVKVLAVNSEKYTVDPETIPSSYKEKTGIEFVDMDLRIRKPAAFLNLFSAKSYHVQRFISKAFKKKLLEILSVEKFDVVQFEMLYMSPYLVDVRNNSNAITVLRAHNLEHLIWERLALNEVNFLKKWYLGHLSKTLKHYELSVIRRFDGIVAITQKDAGFFQDQLRDCSGKKPSVIAIPFGLDPGQYSYTPETVLFPSVFSLGSMDWIPNVEGIRWFLEKVWPELNRLFPDLRFYIAGRHMPDWLLNSNYNQVEVVGEVEDARRFINSKAIMVVPVFSGSGIRIKIIEGMAAGKTIVSTTIGAEGISYTDEKNILIADDPEGFISRIAGCIRNKEKFLSIGMEARSLIEHSYNRDQLIRDLLAFYQNIRG